MSTSINIYCNKLKDNYSPWCDKLIPNVYPYLQENHWKCGWFKTGLRRFNS